MMMGRTDEVDGHFIATRFVGLVVPTESMYFAAPGGRSRMSAPDRVRIPIDWKSVALGIGRVWFPFLAVALPIGQALFGHLRAITFLSSLIFTILAIVAHRGGQLPDAEKDKLRLLGSVTGYRIDPARLRLETRIVKRDQLGELMEKAGIPLTSDGILSILDDIPIPALPLVYGYARYAGDAPAWRECADILYQRHQQAEI